MQGPGVAVNELVIGINGAQDVPAARSCCVHWLAPNGLRLLDGKWRRNVVGRDCFCTRIFGSSMIGLRGTEEQSILSGFGHS
uniref:Uncharacterized protein n=1 Tax=Steinernema glaseri TaxID=37863 RepID=A0A1I7ZSH5_9BILA